MNHWQKAFLLIILSGLATACDQLGECNATVTTQIEITDELGVTDFANQDFSARDLFGRSTVAESTCPAYSSGFIKDHNFREVTKTQELMIFRIGRYEIQTSTTSNGLEPIEMIESHLGCEIHTISNGQFDPDTNSLNFVTQVSVTGVTCEIAAQL